MDGVFEEKPKSKTLVPNDTFNSKFLTHFQYILDSK